jgi:hypothetical protein
MTFIVTYTSFSDATPDQLWDTLLDIDSWPSWDVRLESTRSSAGLKKGSTYSLKPVNGNEIEVEVLKADRHVFTDIARVGFGTIETERRIAAADGGSLITQTMRAKIKPESIRAFAKVFWDVWSQGMIDSAKALANVPKQQAPAFASPDEVAHLVAQHRNVPAGEARGAR